jgi:hypothetical protein
MQFSQATNAYSEISVITRNNTEWKNIIKQLSNPLGGKKENEKNK